MFSSPLLLGFDDLERLLDRALKTSGEGYPPYNIERLPQAEGENEVLRITLAVAGFRRQDLEITIEDNQLNIRGRLRDDEARDYLHRGIAGRQFQRAFVLADGMDVIDATLVNGLLIINLRRPEPSRVIRSIEIKEQDHEHQQ
jgi:HSP20 family molecular chaperone IbpA